MDWEKFYDIVKLFKVVDDEGYVDIFNTEEEALDKGYNETEECFAVSYADSKMIVPGTQTYPEEHLAVKTAKILYLTKMMED